MADNQYIPPIVSPNNPNIISLTASSQRNPPSQHNLPPAVNSPSIAGSETSNRSFRNSIRQGDMIDETLIQAYVIRLFTKYSNNAEDYRDLTLWESIHFDFEDFTEYHWDLLENDQWVLIQKVCYTQGIWLDHHDKKGTRSKIMYDMVQEDYYEDWTMKEIEWVEDRYKTLSRRVQSRKEKLLGVNAGSQGPASLLFPAANQGFVSTTPVIPPPQSERLLQQSARRPTWNQSEPQAQNPEIQISQDVRNEYQSYQPRRQQYPSSIPTS